MSLQNKIKIPGHTKIKISTHKESKVVDIPGARSTALKKLSRSLAIPGESSYELGKTGKAVFTTGDGVEVEVEVVDVVKPRMLTTEEYILEVRQKQADAKAAQKTTRAEVSTEDADFQTGYNTLEHTKDDVKDKNTKNDVKAES